MKKLNKKYADLMRQAQQATGRKEAVGLIHKAAKLKINLINTRWCNLNWNTDINIWTKKGLEVSGYQRQK